MLKNLAIRKFTASTFLILSAAFLPCTAALAQTPPEVLSLYKEFKAAEKAGDTKLAKDKAFDAWQKAEKILGDHKITGDLANNFAYASDGIVSYKLHKKRESAIKRSIALAKFHTEDSHIRELERRLYLTAHKMTLGRTKNKKVVPVNNINAFRDTEKALKKYNLLGTTFEADLETLKSRYYNLREDQEKALSHAQRALALYDSKTDDYTSAYSYFVRIFKGDIHKSQDDKISAALEYQTVMQNLEGDLPSDHPFIERAFNKWITTRYDIEDAGLLSQAEAAGLCECWPFEDYKSKPTPRVRVPPIMPRSARRSGHVVVKFDIDDTGQPINIQKVSSTETVFDKPALKSVEKWKYDAITPDQKAENRQDLTSRITFMLSNSRGELIPEPGI